MANHVCISYCRADARYAHRLVAHLATAGIPTWIDEDINYGALWEKVVCHHIDTCTALVVLMSPHAEKSIWVANEIARAQLRRKPILPLLLSGEVLFRLGHLQYVDVTDGTMPGPRFTAHLRNLTQSTVDIVDPAWA